MKADNYNEGQEWSSDRYPVHYPFATKSAIYARRCKHCDCIFFGLKEHTNCGKCRK